MDRNKTAVGNFEQQQALKRAREQFNQAIQAGQAAIYDNIGCRIEPGQLVMFAPPPNVWRWLVADVQPILDPRLPPGLLTLTLQVVVPMQVQMGTKVGNLLVVGEQEAAKPPQDEPAPAAEPEPEPAHPQDASMLRLVEDQPSKPDATGHSDD